TGAWTTAVLNTSVLNTIDDSSLASNKITLPAGTYKVDACKAFNMTQYSMLRFKTADDDSIILYSPHARIGQYDGNSDQITATGGIVTLNGVFTIATTTDFILQYRVTDEPGGSHQGLGNAI